MLVADVNEQIQTLSFSLLYVSLNCTARLFFIPWPTCRLFFSAPLPPSPSSPSDRTQWPRHLRVVACLVVVAFSLRSLRKKKNEVRDGTKKKRREDDVIVRARHHERQGESNVRGRLRRVRGTVSSPFLGRRNWIQPASQRLAAERDTLH